MNIVNKDKIYTEIKKSDEVKDAWTKYRNKYPYAMNISYDEIMNVLGDILNTCE